MTKRIVAVAIETDASGEICGTRCRLFRDCWGSVTIANNFKRTDACRAAEIEVGEFNDDIFLKTVQKQYNKAIEFKEAGCGETAEIECGRRAMGILLKIAKAAGQVSEAKDESEKSENT